MLLLDNVTIMIICSFVSLVFSFFWAVHGFIYKTKHKTSHYLSGFNAFIGAGILTYYVSTLYQSNSIRTIADICIFTGMVLAQVGILKFFDIKKCLMCPLATGSVILFIELGLMHFEKRYAADIAGSMYMVLALYYVIKVINKNLKVKDAKTKYFILAPICWTIFFLVGRPIGLLLDPGNYSLDIFKQGLFNTYIAIGFLIAIFCLNSTFFGMTLSTLISKVHNLANSDYLTGLYNRRYFQTMFECNLFKSSKYSLLLIDIDYFKKINDSLGHDVGDLFLKEFAQALKQSIKKFEVAHTLKLARIGGEEFGLAINTGNIKTLSLLEAEIHDCIKAANWSMTLPSPPTVSIGVASQQATSDSYEKVFKNADTALYQSKKSGRNKTTFN